MPETMPVDPEEKRPTISDRASPRAWQLAGVSSFVILAAGVYAVRDTWQSLFDIWLNYDTYGHGLLVLVLSAALVYLMRPWRSGLLPVASFTGVVAVVAVLGIWFVGRLTGLLIVQHFAALALVPAIGLAIFGSKVMRIVAFPAFFLLLAVPVGESLIPLLITWTADFCVAVLHGFGIPVYRDGPFIRIPAGDFLVARACSGIRFLLSTLVLGVLFAYLAYRSYWRRLAFLGICFVVPVVANCLRASGIILIGHFSDMRLAVGVDHVVYGWLFFAIVMMVVFLLGNTFRDRRAGIEALRQCHAPDASAADGAGVRPLVAVCVALLVLFPAAGGLAGLTRPAIEAEQGTARLMPPLPSAGWSASLASEDLWARDFPGATGYTATEYRKGERRVSLLIAAYGRNRQGAEFATGGNGLLDPAVWLIRNERRVEVDVGGGASTVAVRETSVSGLAEQRLVWTWFVVDGSETESVTLAKLLAARGAVFSSPHDTDFVIAVSTDHDESRETARDALTSFVRAHIDQIRRCTAADDAGAGKCR